MTRTGYKMDKGDEGNIRDKGDTGNKIAEMRRTSSVIRMKRVTVNTNDGVTWLTTVRRYENGMQDDNDMMTWGDRGNKRRDTAS